VRFVKREIGYFSYGFIFWLPIGIALVIGVFIFGDFENLGKGFLSFFLPERFVYPGLGIGFWFILFYTTGLIAQETTIGNSLWGIPFFGNIFRKGGATVTIDNLLNLSPCLCLRSETCICYAFILWEEKVKLGNESAGFDLIDIYQPHPPAMVTGRVFSVRKGTLIKLGNKSSDIINILLYGLRRPLELKYLPWEDETEDEFKERVRHFGLDIEPSPSLQSALDKIEIKRRSR
jgi:uncharacterized membrane protein